MDALGVKSPDDGLKKVCAFRGNDQQDYHHKLVRCVLDKGKDVPSVKEWEEKKKHDKEEFRREKKDMMAKAVECRERVLQI